MSQKYWQSFQDNLVWNKNTENLSLPVQQVEIDSWAELRYFYGSVNMLLIFVKEIFEVS